MNKYYILSLRNIPFVYDSESDFPYTKDNELPGVINVGNYYKACDIIGIESDNMRDFVTMEIISKEDTDNLSYYKKVEISENEAFLKLSKLSSDDILRYKNVLNMVRENSKKKRHVKCLQK